MNFNDMRAYLDFLEADGQLRHTDVPLRVDRDNNDTQALMRDLHNENNIALVMRNLQGYNTPDVPLVFNPYGSRERTALTIGVRDPREAKAKLSAILADPAQWHAPRRVDSGDAPCKDVRIFSDDISLDQQIPTSGSGAKVPPTLLMVWAYRETRKPGKETSVGIGPPCCGMRLTRWAAVTRKIAARRT